MQKYVVVHFIQKVANDAEFTAENWPLHITVTPRFAIDLEPLEILELIAKSAANRSAIEVIAKNDDFFGPNRDIKVTLMEPNQELIALHKDLVRLLQDFGAILDEPQHFNNGYRAHATLQKSGRLNKGDSVLINDLTLVDMFPNQKISRREALGAVKLGKQA